MKKLIYLIVLVLILGLALAGCTFLSNIGQVPSSQQSGISRSTPLTTYDDVVLSGGFQSGHFPEVWDLFACDMTISFTYDANGLVDDAGSHAWAALGIRQVGYGDFNPTWDVEGAGVWLATDYDWAAGTFDPDPVGSPTLDTDDKLILQKAGGHGEGDYNLPSSPPNPWANHSVWFDRDGVDQWQAQMWGAIDGVTYNTGGTYDVIITLNATSDMTGEAYMNINGEPQGFYVPDWHSGPADLMPAGMTFTGDMTKMQVFYGLFGDGATHNVSFNDITVDGCLLRTIVINGCDTGVFDVLYDGMRISEYIENIYIEAKNHGQFVRRVALLTNELMKAGIITGEEKGKIQSCAAQANQLPKEDGLVLWLDAGKGITQSGGFVSEWKDQSGNVNHAVQANTSFQPIYIPDGLNNNPVVRFPGGEKYLCHSSILTASYTAFYVLKLNESEINKVYYYHAGSVRDGDLGFFAETRNKEEGWGSAGNADTFVTVRTSELYPTPLDWRIHTHQPEALYKDGIEVVYARDDNVYAGSLTDIGSRSDHATLYFVGDIAEILVYDRILTVHEREMVETYLNAKYNIY